MTKRVLLTIIGLVLLASTACQKRESAAKPSFLPVKLGLLHTTAGKGGELANPSLGAAAVAADHLDADHKVAIEREDADYQGDLAIVGQLAQGLADNAEAIIVATDDPAVLPFVTGLGVPVMLTYITTDGALTDPNLYRLVASDRLQSDRLAHYLIAVRGYRRLGIVYEETDYGKAGSVNFFQSVSNLGGSLVTNDTFPTGGDIHTPVMRAADALAEALVIWTDNPAEAARVVIEVHRMSLSYQLAVPGNVAVPQFGKNAVAQVVPTAFREGILSVGPWAGPWLRSEEILRFYRDFETKQNDLAPVLAAQVYDAVLALSAAKAQGPTLGSGLLALSDFHGTGVPITFDTGREGIDLSDLWAWGFTKAKDGAGSGFFPAVDTGGGFFTLIPNGLTLPSDFAHLVP